MSTTPLATPNYDHIDWMTPKTATLARTGPSADDCANATEFRYERGFLIRCWHTPCERSVSSF